MPSNNQNPGDLLDSFPTLLPTPTPALPDQQMSVGPLYSSLAIGSTHSVTWASIDMEDPHLKTIGRKPKAAARSLVCPLCTIHSPMVKDDSTPRSRVSVFSQTYPRSKDEDWGWYPWAGWVYKDEDVFFKSNYGKCSLSGKYFQFCMLERYHKDGFINKDEALAAGYDKCHISGLWFPVRDLIRKARDEEGNWVNVSKSWLNNNSYLFEKCDYSGDLFIDRSTVRVKGSDNYRRIAIIYLAIPNAPVARCPQCGNYYENKDFKVHPSVCPSAMCRACGFGAIVETLIMKHNWNKYPSVISTTCYRYGHRVGDDGLIYATGEKTKIYCSRTFGWEAEVEMELETAKKRKLDRAILAQGVYDCLGKDYVILKEDGSLITNGKYSDGEAPGRFYAGFEIVSAPADLEAHRMRLLGTQFLQRKSDVPLLDSIKNFDSLRSWDTDTCGFHVHVGRSSLSNLQIGRMLRFVNASSNAKFIHKIAGRGSDRYCRYYDKEFSDALHPERVISKEEQENRNRSRRVALNISGASTVEFRIFRGTINAKHMIRNIEFCDAVCDFCYPASRSIKEIDDYKRFIIFIGANRKKWPLLAEWLAYQKMISVNKIKEGIDPKKLTIRPDSISEADPVTIPKKKEPEPYTNSDDDDNL